MGLTKEKTVCRNGHIGKYGWQAGRYRCIECRRAIHRKSMNKLRETSDEFKKYMVVSNRLHRARNPLKAAARAKLQYAVRLGRVVKPDHCSSCLNGGKIQAHHPDYSKPLDVVWLCIKCHEGEHHVAI